ncbi:MAG TPA: hypothetical protein VFH88_06315 [Candidatus Krumholzibacteria bacterium]|nr:hypothetical protein [Candidatus Krumholzibacteria bacterium]
MRARLLSGLVPVLALAVAGCAAPRTDLVNLWIDADHASAPATHVMVVALWQDAEARALWEERFADVLKQKGVTVTPSYRLMSWPMPDSAAVFRVAARQGCDAVVVIHEHVVDRNSFYIPGYTTPRAQMVPRWYRFTGHTEVWSGDTAAGWRSLTCDVELWMSGERSAMVWSATGDVVDPGSDDYAASSAAITVVSELERLGLVPSRL